MGNQSTLPLLFHPDKQSLLEEVNIQKKMFSERLSELPEKLKDKGERWGCPCSHSALRLLQDPRRRAESIWQPLPRPFPGIPIPAHVLHAYPHLLPASFPAHSPTPPGSVCLPSTSVSLPSHPPGQPATTPVVSIFGDWAWAKDEGHLVLSKALAYPLLQTYPPHWRSSTVPTARHTSSPARTQLSAQVSSQ